MEPHYSSSHGADSAWSLERHVSGTSDTRGALQERYPVCISQVEDLVTLLEPPHRYTLSLP